MSKSEPTATTPVAPADAALLGALRQLLREESGDGGAPAPAVGPDANYRAFMAAQRAEEDARPLIPEERIPCQSPETGASFVAIMSYPKTPTGEPHPKYSGGRVLRLDGYEMHESAEGRVPKHLQGRDRLLWLSQNNWIADCKKYIDGPHHLFGCCADEIRKIRVVDPEKRSEATAPAAARP
jgi:hypothetical protein